MKLNLAVGKINHVLPNFIPPTYNSYLHYNSIETATVIELDLMSIILNQPIFNNTAYSSL